MKRLLISLFFVAACFAVLGATIVREGEPRNVRFRAQTLSDSIGFDLRWNAPQRTARQTPILGYEWEIWTAADAGDPWGTRLATGTTVESVRQVARTLPYSCVTLATYYTARVRATGNFSSSGAWGPSGSVEIVCDNSPPGPPVVDLDTIQADAEPTEPDSLVLLPVELGHVGWEREGQKFSFSSLGDVAKMCAFTYRGGVGRLAPRGSWVATMDSAQVVTRGDVVAVADAPPLESSCWYLSAVGNGTTPVHLCTTDCPPTLAFGFPFLPHWMKWPLFFVGVGLWAFGTWYERKKRNVRPS